jgi:hypothetical protein
MFKRSSNYYHVISIKEYIHKRGFNIDCSIPIIHYNLPSEKTLSTSASSILNASQPTTKNISTGSASITNATSALSENVTGRLGNATVALENAIAGLVNSTKA